MHSALVLTVSADIPWSSDSSGPLTLLFPLVFLTIISVIRAELVPYLYFYIGLQLAWIVQAWGLRKCSIIRTVLSFRNCVRLNIIPVSGCNLAYGVRGRHLKSLGSFITCCKYQLVLYQ